MKMTKIIMYIELLFNLVLYSLVFALPIVVIVCIIAATYASIKKNEKLRQKAWKVTGVVFLVWIVLAFTLPMWWPPTRLFDLAI